MTDTRKIDQHKLQFHPIRVAQTLQADTWDKYKEVVPIYAEVGTTNFCNFSCSFCGIDYARKHDSSIDVSIFNARIKELGSVGLKSLMFAGEGESLLHKGISSMIQATKDAGVDVSITTNGVPMTQKFIELSLKNVSWIKVSFNASSPEKYADIHKCRERDFFTVCENIKFAVEYRKQHGIACDLGMQMVLVDDNAHEAEEFVKLSKTLGVDYAVIKRYSQHTFSDTQIHKDTDYSKYLDLGKRLEGYADENFSVVFRSNSMVEASSYSKCLSLPLWMYIDSNLDIYNCSAYLLQDRFNLGNLNDSDFKTIWQGSKRQALFEEGICIDECRKNCRMNHANIYLDQIANDKVPHVNFI